MLTTSSISSAGSGLSLSLPFHSLERASATMSVGHGQRFCPLTDYPPSGRLFRSLYTKLHRYEPLTDGLVTPNHRTGNYSSPILDRSDLLNDCRSSER